VVEEKLVEENFVSILQSAQIDVSLQVVVLVLVGLVSADYLLLLSSRREAAAVRATQTCCAPPP